MVKTPIYKVEANGKDVTGALFKDIKSISLTDNAGTASDKLTITFTNPTYKRPKYEDEIKVWFGYAGEPLIFMGSFKVQTSKRSNNQVLVVTATGADFSSKLKQKHSANFENMSIKDICSLIAKKHDLNLKSDFDDIVLKHKLQTNQSDLDFLEQLAKDYNAIFSIKNNTLIFLKANQKDKINKDLPTFTFYAHEVGNLEITHSNKLYYNTCEAIWHDTDAKKKKKIKVGDGDPIYTLKGNFRDEADAKTKAEAKLAQVNKGIVKGSFNSSGREIFAGGNLELKGTINGEDDGTYSIKSVKHKLSNGDWKINVEFEK